MADSALRGNFARREFIHITPDPGFARLNGTDKRMLGTMEMLGRVLVLGRIAAADVPAFQAQPQMDPAIAGLDAVFADIGIGGFEFDLLQVAATLGHGFSP
jgi:hypothetical protein